MICLGVVDLLLLLTFIFSINIAQLFVWDNEYGDLNAFWFISQIAFVIICLSAAFGAYFA